MRCVFFFLFLTSVLWAQDLDYPTRRSAMLRDLESGLKTIDQALLQSPEDLRLLSQRGDHHLFLAHFDLAVRDFEKMIALDSAQDAPHWRLGIAYFFNSQFEKSARQFEKYHAHDGRDRENGIWKFLADAHQLGIEKARPRMLEYQAFDRLPFPSLYSMFAGQKTPEQVLTELHEQPPIVQFFGNYYVGLQEVLLEQKSAARTHLEKAVSIFAPTLGSDGGPGYMWQVARLQAEALAAQPAIPPAKP